MSYQPNGGGYMPTGYSQQNGASPDERSPKRIKMSPPAANAFKAPMPQVRFSQMPNSQAAPSQVKQEGQDDMAHKADINDLGDIMYISGVNEKAEEEFMASSYRRQPTQSSQQSLQSNQYARYGYHPQQSNNFDLSRGSFPSIGQRPGNLGQPVQSQEEIDRETEEKQRRSLRAFNERKHLQDPFLYGNSMRWRMERIANDNGIKLNMDGLFDKIPQNKPGENKDTKELKHAEEGGGSIVLEKAPSLLHHNKPLDGIMSLLSLAANERIRDLMENAFELARGRQLGSDGKVPEEWQDLAVPQDTQMANGDTPQPLPPVEKPISIASALAQLTRADRQAEEARLKKRAERRARKDAAAANGTATSPNDQLTNGVSALGAASGNTPGPGLIAPDGPKISKKELAKQAKADVSEEYQVKQANSALKMALGGGGKRYSWMGGGNKSAGASGVGTPMGASRSGTPGLATGAKAGKKAADPNAVDKHGLPSKELDRKYGVWREDGEGGKDVQLRDWVCALEMDGREKRALATALGKLGRERLLDGEGQA